MVGSKAEKDEIVAISGEFESFKASVETMFASVQQQLEDGLLNSRKLKEIEDGLTGVHEELNNLNLAEQPHVNDEQQPEKASEPVIEARSKLKQSRLLENIGMPEASRHQCFYRATVCR
ncbi:MAG: hypothetical protein R2741_15675 [Methanolobus sp.]